MNGAPALLVNAKADEEAHRSEDDLFQGERVAAKGVDGPDAHVLMRRIFMRQ